MELLTDYTSEDLISMIKKMLINTTQKQLADKLGVNQQDICNALKGKFNKKLLQSLNIKTKVTYHV